MKTSGIDPDLEGRFVAFFRAHRERVHRVAWRLVGGDDAAAEDVVQEAFLKGFQGLRTYTEQSKLEAWFYRILVRQAANQRRWRSLRTLWMVSDDVERADPRPAEPGDPVLARRIADALEALSRGQREAFVLVHMEGFTVSEAAQAMGRAQGTVKSHLQRALVSLRKQLADLRADDVAQAGGAGE